MSERLPTFRPFLERSLQSLGVLALPFQPEQPTDPHALARLRLEQLQATGHSPFGGNKIVIPRMFELAQQLNDRLGSYDLVVGEDTSGRLPALVYWRIVNARRRELGLQPAAIRFVNGRYRGTWPAGSIPSETDTSSRALIVTEYVESGRSIKTTYGHVSQARIQRRIDVASVGSSLTEEELPFHPESNFYYVPSRDGVHVDTYLYDPSLAKVKGVFKSKHLPFSLRHWQYDGAQVSAAREDLRLLADAMYTLLPPVAPMHQPEVPTTEMLELPAALEPPVEAPVWSPSLTTY